MSIRPISIRDFAINIQYQEPRGTVHIRPRVLVCENDFNKGYNRIKQDTSDSQEYVLYFCTRDLQKQDMFVIH